MRRLGFGVRVVRLQNTSWVVVLRKCRSYWQQNRLWTVTKQLKEEGVNILGGAKVQILHHFVIAQQAKSCGHELQSSPQYTHLLYSTRCIRLICRMEMGSSKGAAGQGLKDINQFHLLSALLLCSYKLSFMKKIFKCTCSKLCIKSLYVCVCLRACVRVCVFATVIPWMVY